MNKKVAVMVVNPVNGLGLFSYLEHFFENNIQFKTFAVAESKTVKTNSGIKLETDYVVNELIGKTDEFDALVFACGNAMPKFAEKVNQSYNQALLKVINAFADKRKLIAGHCAAALLFDNIKALYGKRVALHPLAKNLVQNVVATDKDIITDNNLFTAKDENEAARLASLVVQALNN